MVGAEVRDCDLAAAAGRGERQSILSRLPLRLLLRLEVWVLGQRLSFREVAAMQASAEKQQVSGKI